MPLSPLRKPARALRYLDFSAVQSLAKTRLRFQVFKGVLYNVFLYDLAANEVFRNNALQLFHRHRVIPNFFDKFSPIKIFL